MKPNNIHQVHMEKICEICGDIGFQEEIITCYHCKNIDVHRYCMFGYYEDAPVDWCCEECSGGSTVLEHRSPDAVNESRIMDSSTTLPCDPALVPSWKGNFDILGALELAPGIFNNCIQAHPPSRVRRKVYEFSRRLPDTLKLKLVPRGDIWPSLFNNHCPGKEDIGLYFFASERERSERYIALVEFMRSKDLVMRTLMNDVELFILASTALCSDSQRWNNEHFLWGLFYRPRQETDGCVEGGSNKVIDMEIM